MGEAVKSVYWTKHCQWPVKPSDSNVRTWKIRRTSGTGLVKVVRP